MKITVLGSAAAEGIPSLWCECEYCRKAFQNGGKDIRKRTAYLIDEDTWVDFGPDAFFQMLTYRIDLLKIKQVLFTHVHEDHLNPVEFLWRKGGFGVVTRNLDVYGSRKVLGHLLSVCADTGALNFSELHMTPHLLEHGQSSSLAAGMTLIPLDANHAPGCNPHFFIIQRGGKSLLLANDTGWPPEQSMKEIAKYHFDAVILDSTMGIRFADAASGHMGVAAVVRLRDALKAMNCISDSTPVYANHFSHNGWNLHSDLEAYYNPKGIQVGYDGLVISI